MIHWVRSTFMFIGVKVFAPLWDDLRYRPLAIFPVKTSIPWWIVTWKVSCQVIYPWFIWLLVLWNMNLMTFHDFPFSWECHRAPTDFHSIIFQRGWAQPPSSYGCLNHWFLASVRRQRSKVACCWVCELARPWEFTREWPREYEILSCFFEMTPWLFNI